MDTHNSTRSFNIKDAIKRNFKRTREASIHRKGLVGGSCSLNERLMLVAIAVGTYPMEWFAALYLSLRRVDSKAGSNFKHLVICGLRFPVFHCYYFLVKFISITQQFMVLRKQAETVRLERYYESVKLDRLHLDCLSYFR